ncbi:MAG: 50S ribosomal protein L22 [Deltaproteobacteria bacterium]|jgi:large subunit ribosomal protein L22|nr:50S ribosomal protein L22 [Deltaproteobacteria bacterium]
MASEVKSRKDRRKDPNEWMAIGRFLRCPPDKARLRARLLPGKGVEDALNLLRNSETSSARLISKVLYSAMYNAINTSKPNPPEPDQLVVRSVVIDKGKFLKRHQPVSHGKAEPILKRTCHITVTVARKP